VNSRFRSNAARHDAASLRSRQRRRDQHIEQRHEHLHRRRDRRHERSFTLLVLSDNALLTNSGQRRHQPQPNAKSNESASISATARWLMKRTLRVAQRLVFPRSW